MRALRPLLALSALVASGCNDQNLSQPWQLDRVRVLAVRAEPAEARPGETVSFEALYYVPDGGSIGLALWFACLPSGADDFGCQLDSSALEGLEGLDDLDLKSLTPEEQAELYQRLIDAGLIGAEPLIAPTWTTPADALEGLSEQERLEGVSAIVNITAIPATGDEDATEQPADTELAYKRLPISEAATPNHNPTLTGLMVDGEVLAAGSRVERIWGQDVQIEPLLSDDSLETYVYRTEAGEDEDREEEPFVTWYTEEGSFDQPFGLYPYMEVAWTPPAPKAVTGSAPYTSDEVREVEVIAVIRDRRGGMDWANLTIVLSSPDGPLPATRVHP